MDCCNKKCAHIFKEKDYICCPACGEPQQDRLPQDSFTRAQIIAKHFKIKKLVKLNKYIYDFAIIWILIEGFIEFCLRYPDRCNSIYRGAEGFLELDFGIISVILLLAFGYFDEKVMFLKKKIGERAYFVTKLFFLNIKVGFIGTHCVCDLKICVSLFLCGLQAAVSGGNT